MFRFWESTSLCALSILTLHVSLWCTKCSRWKPTQEQKWLSVLFLQIEHACNRWRLVQRNYIWNWEQGVELREGKRGADVEIPMEITELKLSFVEHKKCVKPFEKWRFLVHFHKNTEKYIPPKTILKYTIKWCQILFLLSIIFLRYY